MIRFFILSLLLCFSLSAAAQQFPQPADCRDRIASIICLVEPASDTDSNLFKRPCLPESSQYQSIFERHYDRSPEVIKKMYCHLERVFVEKSFPASAYASPITDSDGKIVSAAVGIRQEILDSPQSYPHWLTWKEEVSFGGSTSTTAPSMNLIHYQSNDNSPDMAVDFIMAHEFGHVFDFVNKFNQLLDCKWEKDPNGDMRPVGSCTPAPDSWSALSWAGIFQPLPANDYPLRKETCFYFCNGKFLSPNDSAVIFNGLMGSNFVSTYAASNMGDDWAESFAYYIVTKARGVQLQVETQGIAFDLTGHFHSSYMTTKRTYIENFLQGPFLYPGEGDVHQSSLKIIIDR